jgi:RNA polymerase sigma-70 factor (ECF subfamily)
MVAASSPLPGFENDDAILCALRAGDERAFVRLVEQWSGALLHVAMARVGNRAIAEEIVQEAWLTMLRSLDRFERRSSLRTWVIGITINLARARARVEQRTVPLAADEDGAAVEPRRFLPADHPRWPHHWAVEPAPWPTPEDALIAQETRDVLLAAIASLPPAQREVLVLRDLHGMPAPDVCNVLGVTDTNQRVLLHRARSRVRHALERYFAAAEAT